VKKPDQKRKSPIADAAVRTRAEMGEKAKEELVESPRSIPKRVSLCTLGTVHSARTSGSQKAEEMLRRR
jgi:hypothetical protein